jgi:hypothetical protein
VGLPQSVNVTQVTLATKTKPSTYVGFSCIKRNFVHSNQIFITIMQLLSKPIKFATMSVLVSHVHVVASIDNYICDLSMGASTSQMYLKLHVMTIGLLIENVHEKLTYFI